MKHEHTFGSKRVNPSVFSAEQWWYEILEILLNKFNEKFNFLTAEELNVTYISTYLYVLLIEKYSDDAEKQIKLLNFDFA